MKIKGVHFFLGIALMTLLAASVYFMLHSASGKESGISAPAKPPTVDSAVEAAPASVLSSPDPSPSAFIAEDPAAALAVENYFKTLNDANSSVYEVKPGDNLTRIAQKYGVTPGLIQAANFLKSDRIRPGQKLRIMKDKWSITVNKSQNTLMLNAEQSTLRTYRVATGKDRSTPPGTFKIINHLKNPTWYYEGKVISYDSPDNPLGTRWLGLDKDGYGIHGTTKPEEIGQFATLGCIRMLNADIEPLFDLVPDGTTVTIID